jgi:hypothetical protein
VNHPRFFLAQMHSLLINGTPQMNEFSDRVHLRKLSFCVVSPTEKIYFIIIAERKGKEEDF